eukprot:gene1345-2595_t
MSHLFLKILFSLYFFPILLPEVLSLNEKLHKVAITVLIRGDNNKRWNSTNNDLAKRNQFIKKYLWIQGKYDMIIFYTDPISIENKNWLQSQDDLPIRFIDVSSKYNNAMKPDENPICPSNPLTRNFTTGYKSMCHFWFVTFETYLKEYDSMLRIDDDCEITKGSRKDFPPPKSVVFSSTHWQHMEFHMADGLSLSHEGGTVTGLRSLSNRFMESRGLTSNWTDWKGWKAPYTNVMFIRLDWLRTNDIVKAFIETVVESNCIYSNRWGDLSLWGVALLMAGVPPHHLKIPYYHSSHKTSVLLNNKLIHYV